MLCLVDGEVDVTETEGLGAVFAGRFKALNWAEHPVEPDDAEVDDVAVGLSVCWVVVLRHA